MQTLRILFVCSLLGIGPVTVSLAEEVQILDINGKLGDAFGSVAIVGAKGNDDPVQNGGAAHIFVRNGETWKQQAKLTARDAAKRDKFGISVGIHRDTVIVGASGKAEAGSSSGAAYIFVRNGEKWTQQVKLTPDDGAQQDKFGLSVSIFHNTVIVGASGADGGGKNAGAAYSFSAPAHRGSRGQRSSPATRQIVTNSGGRRDWGRIRHRRDYRARHI